MTKSIHYYIPLFIVIELLFGCWQGAAREKEDDDRDE